MSIGFYQLGKIGIAQIGAQNGELTLDGTLLRLAVPF